MLISMVFAIVLLFFLILPDVSFFVVGHIDILSLIPTFYRIALLHFSPLE